MEHKKSQVFYGGEKIQPMRPVSPILPMTNSVYIQVKLRRCFMRGPVFCLHTKHFLTLSSVSNSLAGNKKVLLFSVELFVEDSGDFLCIHSQETLKELADISVLNIAPDRIGARSARAVDVDVHSR